MIFDMTENFNLICCVIFSKKSGKKSKPQISLVRFGFSRILAEYFGAYFFIYKLGIDR